MTAYRLLHTADVHLDAAFGGASAALGARRREQVRAGFERVLSIAKQHAVDALCIAGDLYEDGRAGPDRANYLRRTLAALAPIRVFISPGNHDPFTPSSLYSMLDPPDNVHVFPSRRFDRIELCDGLTLWGCAHERPLDRDPILQGVQCGGDGTHLLLFHGTDRDRIPPGKETIAPFDMHDIERTGAAHAMLGHFHGCSSVGRYAYPGSPEPLNRTETGRHSACMVSVQAGRVETEFIDVNRTRYVDEELDVGGISDGAALIDAVKTKLAAVVSLPGSIFCTLRLVGSAVANLDADLDTIAREIAALYPGSQIVLNFSAFDLNAIEKETGTVRGAFVKAMRNDLNASAAEDRARIEKALEYGLVAFSGQQLRP
ncbi:MAG: metallophosphoesterase [Candidatus Eremiobacteraeota bacterium]|nr:metallophosphoesterase [Candidatus Eremiobacteraeota bacterium]